MTKVLSNIILVSLLFAVYQLLALSLIEVTSFSLVSLSSGVFSLILVGAFFVGNVLFWLVLKKLFKESEKIFLRSVINFLLTSLVVGFVLTHFMQPGYGWVLMLSILVVSLLPVALVFWFYLLREIENKLSLSILHSEEPNQPKREKIVISNPSGKILFKAVSSNVIAFEANDNYVLIHYIEGDVAHKQMERISLKKIEGLLKKNSILFFRVHKSFIVNPLFVSEVSGVSQAYKLKLKHFNEFIPVSRQFDIETLRENTAD
jgi:hypothetical protein